MTEQIPQIVTYASYTASVQEELLVPIDQWLYPIDGGPVSYDWVIENLTSEQIVQLCAEVDKAS
tara:strand:- start:90 stop:281 length:192 start_codon:yes stop_codon:yes gene_type:complete